MRGGAEMHGVIAVGKYDGLLRDVARGCSEGSYECACQAGRILAAFVPGDAVIIPMPGRDGVARWSRTMAEFVCSYVDYRRVILDCLRCGPHELSRHTDGMRPPVAVWVKPEFQDVVEMLGRNRETRFIVVDNVVCTGRMARGAIEALRFCGVPDEQICVLALCKSQLSYR